MLKYDPNDKRIGSYLIDAGLLTAHQVDVALNDQMATGMKFGEIVVTRGWISQKTMNFFVNKIVDIERGLGEPLCEDFVVSQKARKKKTF